mgnify:CR=1 FL=1
MDTPPGLALLLERGSARLVADGVELGGARVAAEFAVRGAARSVGECRGRVEAVERLRVTAAREVLARWLGRGWPKGQVDVDAEAWTLTGAEGLWWRLEVGVTAEGGCLVVRPRRSWLLGGAPGLTAERAWLALARRLTGCGVRMVGRALVVDVGLAVVGRWFAASGWRAPGLVGARVRWTGEGVEIEGWSKGQDGRAVVGSRGWLEGQVRGGTAERGWLEGQVVGDCPGGHVDVLAGERAGLAGSAGERVQACERLRGVAGPGLAGPLARARARALRFVDPAGCVQAVREWAAAAPDAEAWWWLAVQARGSATGLAEGLAGLADGAGGETRAGLVLALAQALERVAGRAAEARTLLEPRMLGGEAPAEVWRTVARLRAADPAAKAVEVEAALVAALGEDGWRRRGEAGDLRGAIAEAVMRSGRTEASMSALLRRILIGRRKRAAATGEAEVVGMRASTQIVADYYAQDGRWRELVALLERELGRMEAAPRAEAQRRIARIRRHYLRDPEPET